jgi:hypothetical protein
MWNKRLFNRIETNAKDSWRSRCHYSSFYLDDKQDVEESIVGVIWIVGEICRADMGWKKSRVAPYTWVTWSFSIPLLTIPGWWIRKQHAWSNDIVNGEWRSKNQIQTETVNWRYCSPPLSKSVHRRARNPSARIHTWYISSRPDEASRKQ